MFNDMSKRFCKTREQMIAFHEELDWQCYNFYKITTAELWLPNQNDVPRIRLGERAFEIIMARQMAAVDRSLKRLGLCITLKLLYEVIALV